MWNYEKAGSAFLRLAHLLIAIFNFATSILTSFLHFGQNRGKFANTVSAYTFVLVFPSQNGQRIHKGSWGVVVTG